MAERTQQKSANSPWGAFKSVMMGKPQELMELRNVATELAAAVMLVARGGNVERIESVRELLEQVKREIYVILAENKPEDLLYRQAGFVKPVALTAGFLVNYAIIESNTVDYFQWRSQAQSQKGTLLRFSALDVFNF